jgi:hypothetical protein
MTKQILRGDEPSTCQGEDLHLGLCTHFNLPFGAGVQARERQGVLPPAMSLSTPPHTTVYQPKAISGLKLLNKCFRMVSFTQSLPSKKSSLLSLMWFTALKKNEVYSQLDDALHTDCALHFHGLLQWNLPRDLSPQ